MKISSTSIRRSPRPQVLRRVCWNFGGLVLWALFLTGPPKFAIAAETTNAKDVLEAIADRRKEVNLRVNGCDISFIYVPPGYFMMGSPAREKGHLLSEEPLRRVYVTKAFYIGKYEVTQAQYSAVIGKRKHPPKYDGDSLPCHDLFTKDARAFCERLSTASGLEVTLPTEAQWEYACRATTQTRFHSGDTLEDLRRVGWFKENSSNRPHPVGEKEPNAFGLYDMHGNVAEFCLDSLDSYDTLPDENPVGRTGMWHTALRGGDWFTSENDCRSANRSWSNDRFIGQGMRLAINPPKTETGK